MRKIIDSKKIIKKLENAGLTITNEKKLNQFIKNFNFVTVL